MMGSRELNQDMIMEILSRSSYETTTRCRLLCKDIERLTHESHFIKLHSQRTDIVQGVFMQSFYHFFVYTESNKTPKSNLSLDFLPCKYPTIASCDSNTGILFCKGSPERHESSFFVCKPSTKQWRHIPRPRRWNSAIASGISVLRTKPLRFKIINAIMVKPRAGCRFPRLAAGFCCLCWEVFDSDVWSWRISDTKCLPDRLHRSILGSRTAISFCGRLHWLTKDGCVISICVETESIDMFSPPEGLSRHLIWHHHNTCVKLLKYKGKLGLIHLSDDWSCIDLWVMEDYQKHSWILKHKLDVRSVIDKNTSVFYGVVWPFMFYGSFDESKKFMYNFETDNKIAYANMCPAYFRFLFPFCSDMEKVDFEKKSDAVPAYRIKRIEPFANTYTRRKIRFQS